MNNIQKFNETKRAISEFQKQISYFEEEAQNKLDSKGIQSRAYMEAFLVALQTKELSIDRKGRFIMFESTTLGSYTQPIRKNKRMLNPVPICFLLHLYMEDLDVKDIIDEDQTDIPFTLRGFWEIEKAKKLVEDLISLQVEAATIIQKIKEANKEDKKREQQLNKILQVIESLEVFVINNASKQMYEIYFEEELFKVNKKNRKLDIVPLCKMLTSYYVRIINYIEDYKKLLGVTEDKEDIYEVKEGFMKLMEKYFTIYIVKC